MIPLFSAAHRLLAVSAAGVECHRATAHGSVREAAFGSDEQAAFAAYAKARRRAVFIVMADLIEEDFRQDTIPWLRGAARAEILARKASQVYRDTSFHTAQSLGREKDGRRDERVLLMALTNAPLLNGWLTPLVASGARVARLTSPPAVAPRLARALLGGAGAQRALVVTLDRAGLRQTLVEAGATRFSRLAAIPRGDPRETAAACLAEVARTQQYLSGLRLLPRDESVALLVVTPPGEAALWQEVAALPASVDPRFIDLAAACRGAGVSIAAGEEFADHLWLALAARARGGIDFAPAWLKEAYRLWQAKSALWFAGAGTLVAGCMVALVAFLGALNLRGEAAHFDDQARRNDANFRAVKATLPPLPATAEQIKAGVLALEKIAATGVTPAALLGDVARALERAPEFALERADWIRGANADDTPEGVSARGGAAAPATPDAARWEIAVLAGTLNARGDETGARAVLASAARTVAALQGVAGAQVQVVRAPYDLSPAGSIASGEGAPPGDARSGAAARAGFTVRIARKAAP